MLKIRHILLCLLLAVVSIATAQSRVITGVVTSQGDGETVPGATILEKGTDNGAIADMDGVYEISVSSEDAVLVVSFIGMETATIATKGRQVIDVELSSGAVAMDEVMVVAYGTAKKDSYTGAASSVSASKLKDSRAESVDKALTGKVAGVRVASSTGDPGSSGEIQIRGIGSISGSTSPLYVIDGVPVSTGDFGGSRASSNILSTLNPSDIESMTVLKDAAAASLYGSRAANGVILITTKKGKSGKTKVNFSANYGVSEMATNSYEMMSGSEYAQYYKDGLQGYYLAEHDALLPTGVNYGDATVQLDAVNFAEENYLNEDWSNITTEEDGIDWRDEIYDGGSDQEYQLSVSGGSEKTDFYTSLGYKNVEGIVTGSDFERISATINLNHKVSDRVKFNYKNQFAYTDQNGHGDQSDQAQGIATSSPLSLLMSANPTAQSVYNADGSYNTDASFGTVENPIQALDADLQTINNTTYRIMQNLGATVNILPGLNFVTTNSVDFVLAEHFNYWSPESIDGESVNGLGERQDNTLLSLTSSNVFNYATTINGLHNVNAIAGYEAQSSKNEVLWASVTDYSNSKLKELANGQASNVSQYVYKSYMQSFLGNASYNYDNKYYVAGSVRNDASSQLGSDNRQATFYSVSGSWRFTQEDFMPLSNVITNGKVRASYGTNGALPSGSYSHQGLYYLGGGYGNESAIYLDQLENADLGWEMSKNFNVALDLQLFKRFDMTLEYYNKYTTDLLLEVPTSYTTGTSSSLQNSGDISNKGIEFEVHANDILNRPFKWNVDFSVATLKATVEKLSGGEDIITGDGNLYIYSEGEDLYSFYLPTYVGVDAASGLGQFLIDPTQAATEDNLTYYYSEAGRMNQGSAYPTVSGALNNSFSWKGFTFNALMTYQFGGQLFDYPGYFSNSDGLRSYSFNTSKNVAGNYWQNPGDVVDNPRPVLFNDLRSDKWSTRQLKSTDFIRLKEVSLSYNIPSHIVERWKIDNATVNFSVNNAAYLYAATDDMELEVALNGYRTVDTPLARTFSFGVNLGF